MKVGENPLYTMMARYLELATEVVLEPTFPFSERIDKLKDAGYFHDIPMSWSLEILASDLQSHCTQLDHNILKLNLFFWYSGDHHF